MESAVVEKCHRRFRVVCVEDGRDCLSSRNQQNDPAR